VTANASPGIAPTGGMRPALGTNPIAIAIPAGRHRPIVVDMATAAIPKNKLLLAAKKGERIPPGLALDAEGRPTTDPAEALKGAILPAAGPKGYGLAVAVDALSGALTGSACALDVISIGSSMTEPPNIGNFFMAIKVDAFLPLEEFKARIDNMIDGDQGRPEGPGRRGDPDARRAGVPDRG
jgi:LDH2 family malate/lactate/ureidoglycolate dehydrogenase